MKNKYLVVLIILLSIICILSSRKNTTFFNEESSINIEVLNTKNNEIYNLDLEDYVIGVVAGEMPASFNIEALKAQAIASRSYALYKLKSNKYLKNDTSNQVYLNQSDMKNKWKNNYELYYKKIKDAVDSTKNKVIKYNGDVIESFYFAISNGKTEDSEVVFGSSYDYLKSIDSKWDMDIKNFIVTKVINIEEFKKILNIKDNIKISNIIRNSSNRIEYITINNKKYKGTEIRKLLNLRSTDFEINIKNDEIEITTKGYGHGVGMSQYGANEMAKNGYNYEEILKYYYKDTYIENYNV